MTSAERKDLDDIDESLEEKKSLEDTVMDMEESPCVSEAKLAIDEINYGVSELIDMRIQMKKEFDPEPIVKENPVLRAQTPCDNIFKTQYRQKFVKVRNSMMDHSRNGSRLSTKRE